LIVGGTLQARAQTSGVTPQQATTTTTVPNALLQLLNGLFPTTTTPPPPPPPTTAPPPPTAAGGGGSDQGGASNAAPGSTTDQTVPPDAQRIIDSVVRSGDSNDLALLDALKPLTDEGLTLEEAAVIGMGQFPVAGEAYWSDDWLEPRFTPTFHLHQGNDIFAARGTPVRSPVDGRLEFASEGAGGLAAYVTAPDGTYYYMAHLDSFATNVHTGDHVKQGTVVGFVGNTGNADGGPTHCHFEIHPHGGPAIDPKSTLDGWVAAAIANIASLLPVYETSIPRPLSAAGLLRRLDTGSLGGPTSSDGPQLRAASASHTGSGLQLAAATAADDPPPVDISARGAQAHALDWARAQQMAADVLAPLTPVVLTGSP
jgi:murein DD-endopeptidase MepM/ murein hydrolase activator NlpD